MKIKSAVNHRHRQAVDMRQMRKWQRNTLALNITVLVFCTVVVIAVGLTGIVLTMDSNNPSAERPLTSTSATTHPVAQSFNKARQ